jgi:hypothetical protein
MKGINHSSPTKEIDMSVDTTRNDRRKWAVLGGLGLGLAMLGHKRRWRRAMIGQMYGGGFGPGRFGGYGPWAHGGPQQPVTLPPFFEATLKAWHDRAHGTVPPTAGTAEQAGATHV